MVKVDNDQSRNTCKFPVQLFVVPAFAGSERSLAKHRLQAGVSLGKELVCLCEIVHLRCS